MTTHTQDLARIASDIDTHGIGANETAVSMVVDRASIAGVDPVLLSVLSDVTQPEIARDRAFGRIATALAAAGPATLDPRPGEHGRHPAMAAA
jgi:hypothetical protein